MPEPILRVNGEIDRDPDNAQLERWSQGTDSLSIDPVYVQRFITETEALLENLVTLEIDPAEPVGPQYMTLFYNAAKETFDHDKSLIRTYFAWLYLVVFQRNEGPRWGDFVEIYGVENFIAHVEQRFSELF